MEKSLCGPRKQIEQTEKGQFSLLEQRVVGGLEEASGRVILTQPSLGEENKPLTLGQAISLQVSSHRSSGFLAHYRYTWLWIPLFSAHHWS